jgi:hypothetical protein
MISFFGATGSFESRRAEGVSLGEALNPPFSKNEAP